APRKRRRATSGVTDAAAKAAAAQISTARVEAEVPAQRAEATPVGAEEERPKRKRRSVRLAEAAAATAAAEAAAEKAPARRSRA
ncbi:hypothetical protein SAMN05414137_101403, partial [Streptacidiphilus jiangxiensis]